MDSSDCQNAILMPSRTIMLENVPAELNNGESLHSYFSRFGALLWVNDKYEQKSSDAVITFFSIGDAIAAFMCSEPVLDVVSIEKSWFQYTKTCELCPYKYSSENSIKQHMQQHHTHKHSTDQLQANEKDVNVPAKGMDLLRIENDIFGLSV